MVYRTLQNIFLIAMSCLLPSFLFAQEKVLTLEQALAEVLTTNPDVQAAEYRATASRAKIPQAKALDDPSIGVEFYNMPTDTTDITKSDDIDYMMQQTVPFPGKRYTRGKAARSHAEAITAESRGDIADVLLDTKRTYYTLYRIDRQLEVNRENQRLYRQLLGSAETQYATGKTSADFALKTQVELSQLQNEEIVLMQEKISHVAHLKVLLNRDVHEDIRIPKTLRWPKLTTSLESLILQASTARPEVITLDSLEKRDRASLTTAKQSFLPDFSFGAAYKQRLDGRQDVWSLTTMMSLPIFWGKNRAMISEARASLKATQAQHQSIMLHTQHEIEQAYAAFRASEDLVSSYRKGILPQAKTTLEVARVSYASGDADFLTLIDAARTYKDVQMSFYETQSGVGTTFAELERLVGHDLTASGGMYDKK